MAGIPITLSEVKGHIFVVWYFSNTYNQVNIGGTMFLHINLEVYVTCNDFIVERESIGLLKVTRCHVHYKSCNIWNGAIVTNREWFYNLFNSSSCDDIQCRWRFSPYRKPSQLKFFFIYRASCSSSAPAELLVAYSFLSFCFGHRIACRLQVSCTRLLNSSIGVSLPSSSSSSSHENHWLPISMIANYSRSSSACSPM